jgi:hypothetical protein
MRLSQGFGFAVLAVLAAGATPERTARLSSTEAARIEAPIGHRQPPETSVPPSAQRDNDARTPDDALIDGQLNICRGC